MVTQEQQRSSMPSYWKPVQHSMTRRNKLNNYHTGDKAYMVTLKIEGMKQLLGRVAPLCSATRCGTQGSGTEGSGTEGSGTQGSGTQGSGTEPQQEAYCKLFPLGGAMRKAWLTLPERFHNISIIDSPEEYVIMPEHFHGIVYVTGYMEEHLSDVIKLFKARVAMSYRKMLVEYAEGGCKAIGYPEGAFRAVGTSTRWLDTYRSQHLDIKIATKAWIERQMAILYSATRCGTQCGTQGGTLGDDAAPFRVTASGKREKEGFLFARGFTDGVLLEEENLEGHREYILNNPKSRWQRSSNRTLLKVNRNNIDTAVSLTALEGYLRKECTPFDVTLEKLAAVRSLLMCSATRCRIEGGTQGGTQIRKIIQCWSYGDRELLERRLLPVVCHRRDAWQFEKQKARCLEEARKGAVIVSACISEKEQKIFNAVKEAGYPVIKIEDNGFPEIYHPSQERIELCSSGRLLIVTPWQYHYRHKDENIFVVYCKTMNCIAQALCRLKDSWWKE